MASSTSSATSPTPRPPRRWRSTSSTGSTSPAATSTSSKTSSPPASSRTISSPSSGRRTRPRCGSWRCSTARPAHGGAEDRLPPLPSARGELRRLRAGAGWAVRKPSLHWPYRALEFSQPPYVNPRIEWHGGSIACPRGGTYLNSTGKTVLLWVVIIVLVLLLWSLFQTTKGTNETIPFNTFLDRVNQGTVEKVIIRGDDVRGETKQSAPGGKHEFRTAAYPNYPAMIDLLRSKGVTIEIEPQHDAPFITALITWAPVLFLIGLWIFFMRQMQAGADNGLSLCKSK